MSEFTDGLLVLREHASLAKAALVDLDHPHLFKHLNEKWSVIVLERPDEPARPWIERHSHDFPMLYFYDAEDHGWGYIIFHKGEEKASLEVSYELTYKYWRQIVELLYPNLEDIHGNLDIKVARQINRLVQKSDVYRQEVKDQYNNLHLEEFALFSIPPERIAHLREFVHPKWYRKRFDGLQQVDVFKEIIGIEEISWVSYSYLNRADSQDRFDNV